MTDWSVEPLTAAHAAPLFAPLCDARLYEFEPSGPPVSLAALEERYRFLAAGRSPARDERWLNWVMHSGGAPVGTLQATIRGEQALIAYLVFVESQRKGHGTRGCRWLLRQLFELESVRLARALIDTRNLASQRLVEAAGLVRVGTIRDADFFKGAASDEFVYELEREAWSAAQK